MVYHCGGKYLVPTVAYDDECLVSPVKNLVIFIRACEHIYGTVYGSVLEFSFQHLDFAALLACSYQSVVNYLRIISGYDPCGDTLGTLIYLSTLKACGNENEYEDKYYPHNDGGVFFQLVFHL